MPVVTRLQRSPRRPDRVHLHLDDAYAFSLPLELAARLQTGQVLGEAEVASLREEAEYRQALDRALRLLVARPRSEAEVRRYLADKAVAPDIAQQVVDRLAELALIDDQAFAAWWVDNRSHHRPRGAWALKQELLQRGVARALIDEAIEGLDEAELATAVALKQTSAYRNLDGVAFRRRLQGFLQRRGFRGDAIRTAVRAAAASRVSAPDEPPHDTGDN
jgi:regulatory protein